MEKKSSTGERRRRSSSAHSQPGQRRAHLGEARPPSTEPRGKGDRLKQRIDRAIDRGAARLKRTLDRAIDGAARLRFPRFGLLGSRRAGHQTRV
jgi:hypothetical protein